MGKFLEGKKLINDKNELLPQVNVAELTSLRAFGTPDHKRLYEKVTDIRLGIRSKANEVIICEYKIKELGDEAYGLVIDAGYDGKPAQRISDKFYSLGRKLVDLENKSISEE